MKRIMTYKILTIAAILSVTLTSCTIAGDIFKGGMVFGILGVVVLVMLVFWVIRSLGR
jgi:hypothetical protein